MEEFQETAFDLSMTTHTEVVGYGEPEVQPEEKKLASHKQFAEFLRTERDQARHCSSLPFTLCLSFLFLLVWWLHGKVGQVHEVRQCLHELVARSEVRRQLPGTDVRQTLTFDRAASAEQVWTWISYGLLPSLAGTADRPGFVRSYNQVIGDVQVRQRRRAQGACKLDEDLQQYFRIFCLDEDTLSTEAFGQAPEGHRAFTAGGGLESLVEYGGGGESVERHFYAWFDVRRQAWSREYAEALQWAGWIDDAMEELEARVTLFNAELQVFIHVAVKFKFVYGGVVDTSLDVRPLLANLYPSWVSFLPDVFWYLLVTKLFFDTLQAVLDTKGRSCMGSCCLDVWRALDWCIAISGFFLVAVFWLVNTGVGDVAMRVGDLGDHPTGQNNATILAMMSDSAVLHELPSLAEVDYHEKTAAIGEELRWLIAFRTYQRLGFVWYALLILMRFCKGFQGQPSMAIMCNTFSVATSDLSHFAFLLIVVWVNFAIGGFVIFGGELHEWSTVYGALHATLNVAHGSADFEAFHRIAPTMAVLWLVLYVIAVVFIMMNMLISIIVYHYGVVRSKQLDSNLHLFVQLNDIRSDLAWYAGYISRRVYHVVHGRLPPWALRILPGSHEVPKRVSQVPYDELLEDIDPERLDGDAPRLRVPKKGLDPRAKLFKHGCDIATTDRILNKFSRFERRNLAVQYPLEVLFNECDNAMDSHGGDLLRKKDDQHLWISKRKVDLENLERRQKTLDSVAGSFQKLHPDGLEQLPEGLRSCTQPALAIGG